MSKNKNIPDRWDKYSNIGEVVEGTRFIAFKVPLSKNEHWNLKELKRIVPDLKVIIDLTNTNRYYQPWQCEELGLIHRKILVPGRVVPNKKIVKEFFSAVSESSGPESGLIGVHCTHGLNRTGYLVCRWMIEVAGMGPDTAIAAFNTARGHDQERDNYLKHLRSKGWENETETESTPRHKWTKHDKQRSGGPGQRYEDHTVSRSRFNNSDRTRSGHHDWRQQRDFHGDRFENYGYESYNSYNNGFTSYDYGRYYESGSRNNGYYQPQYHLYQNGYYQQNYKDNERNQHRRGRGGGRRGNKHNNGRGRDMSHSNQTSSTSSSSSNSQSA